MKVNPNSRPRGAAFTLIELMIVIGIIAVLAAMIFPAGAVIKRKMALGKARTELRQLELAIGAYKTKYGFYPPDNRQNYALNPLFYELKGTSLSNNVYQTLDGKQTLAVGDVAPAFLGALSGFMNCSRGRGDEGVPAQDFLKDLKPGQYVLGNVANKNLALLTCTVQWARDLPPVVAAFAPADATTYPNPWRYNSSNPTNNPGQFDLWVDIISGGKTNRISNWAAKPQIVYDP